MEVSGGKGTEVLRLWRRGLLREEVGTWHQCMKTGFKVKMFQNFEIGKIWTVTM
jgi:hypothetical protein